MISVDRVNEYASKFTILGWFVGLGWFALFSKEASQIEWWAWLALIVVGMFGASIIIGGGISLIMAGLTKVLTGSSDATPDLFAWGAFISPVIAFFCASPVARLFV